MMHDKVKRFADVGDVRVLKYIFVDALDADPTFDRYQEDYEYCRSKGLFEPYQELTPLTVDQRQWTLDYWVQLKTDLLQNFSEKRLMHMKKVAQVLKADEIRQLTEERRRREAETKRKAEEEARRKVEEEKERRKREKEETQIFSEPAQEETPAERRFREQERRKKESDAATKKKTDSLNRSQEEKINSKKASPVVIAAAILGIIVLLAVILMVVSNPGNAAAVLKVMPELQMKL